MENNQIINLVVNAIVTISTNVIAAMLSANHGTAGTARMVYSVERKRLNAYMAIIWFLVIFLFSFFHIIEFAMAAAPIERLDIVLVVFNLLFAFVSISVVIFCIGFLISCKTRS